MVNREMLPAQTLHLTKRVQQFVRIDVVADARVGIDIFQRVDLERAPFLAGDDAARFVGRVAPRLGDELM
jgi:hypothetical protein